MEIVTLKSGDEIRLRGQQRNESPIAVIADVGDGEVTIVLRDEGDLSLLMHNAAAGERQQRIARRLVEKRIRRRLENRRARSV